MKYEIVKDNKYEYVDIGKGPVVIFLHGLMGALSNFEKTANIIVCTSLNYFSNSWNYSL